MPAKRATMAAIMPALITAMLHEVEAYTTYGKTFRQLGLKFPEQLVETAVTSHYRQGGIDVDTATMRSSIPGLYVAGGRRRPQQRADRARHLRRQGRRRWRRRGFRLARTDRPISESECEAERRRLDKLRSRSAAGVAPAKVKERLRNADVGKGRRREKTPRACARRSTTSSKSALMLLPDMRLPTKPASQTTSGWTPSTS